MKIAEISKILETNEDKNLVASVKKALRAYEQTFSEEVDVMDVLADIEQFFTRMQDRYENAFTIRNILSGQQKLLDLPLVRAQLSKSQHKDLQDLTRTRVSSFTKTANEKQRTKGRVTDDSPGQVADEVAGTEGVEVAFETLESNQPTIEPSRAFATLEKTIEEQSQLIVQLKARVRELEGFISAVRIILNLID